MTINTFASIGIEEALTSILAEFGISEPSPVQAQTIPVVLEGKDVLAQSQTGTGKTLAYLLPILQRIDPAAKSVQAVILAPTQELAMQILRESQRYGEPLGISPQALIGGAAIGRQIERLKLHPQLIVGTPGRIKELLAIKKLKMHQVKTLVVDEVDQVFQLGGAGDVEHIIRAALRDRQLLFLSATVSPEIKTLAYREMREPVEVGIEPEQRTSKTLEHVYFVTEERDKIDVLRRIVRTYNAPKVIVFVNNTQDIGEVEAKMNFVGLSAQALYGDADKTTRSLVLRRFREGSIQLLIASDVAARGLDIEDLTLIINYDPPIDSEHYVHRSGRTGRMGRRGTAVSIITPREEFIIRKFSKELGIKFLQQALYGGRLVDPSAPARTGEGSRRPAQGSPRPSRGNTKPAVGAGGGSAQSQSPGRGRSSETPSGERKADRHRDRKNKGAPKWLKDKQNPRS
ncbi:DEAD/DEAH box helicase [Paenibacillus sp. J22TS3]|uniref:DEAD/DEAH box helicase n=1 Tax=Paenibacillus sp. J22TS3 TaxID=2807192 RepID=UPI001B251715|nr:DEAD/DEAH box helicase [Paenibacillus sp. J22TS3]GIP24076.1 DEAD/DEAH box family ATP-dependent RNA helicase [Paenibacillus sp. J22TS3]